MTSEIYKSNWIDAESNPDRPFIVVLCGSCRFKDAFIKAQQEETLAGKIVLSVGMFMPQSEQELKPEVKEMLDKLHFKKIELADEVLILNVGGYIGKSTQNELNYARQNFKTIRFLEPVEDKG